MADLGKMSKTQLETYARKELGVELDRRHSKKQLLAKVQELLEDQEVEEEVVEVLKTPVTPKVSASSSIREIIEDLSEQRRDAAVIWGYIKNGNQTDDEVKSIISSKGFDVLLGDIS